MSALVSLLALAGAEPASACGGFFCDGAVPDPVEQAGEVVLLEVSPEQDEVTMHVRVAFQGQADDFAWLVPLPAEPETFVSTNALFDGLDPVTGPVVSTVVLPSSSCGPDADTDADADSDSDADADTDADTDGNFTGLNVVSTARVGPYETTVLKADTADVLVDWLDVNGYAVPDRMEALVAPYVGQQTWFLALKLASDATTGEIAPLGLRYPGATPAIPIQLTSVAAIDDMPLTVYLLGQARGVPLNYLHVELNPLALPYATWRTSPTLAPNVTRAADEAGGRAFITEFSARITGQVSLWQPGQFTTEGLAEIEHALGWYSELATHGFVDRSDLILVLRAHVPAPALVDEQGFYDCPQCYASAWTALDATFDPVAATADLDTFVVAPRQEAQAMLDRSPWTTRLLSSLSASEMTVDPMFGFNPDLVAMGAMKRLTASSECDEETGARSTAVVLPGNYYASIPGTEYLETIAAAATFDALVVSRMTTSGPPEILVDRRPELLAQLTAWSVTAGDADPNTVVHDVGDTLDEELLGCACATLGPRDLAAVGLTLALGLLARRRA